MGIEAALLLASSSMDPLDLSPTIQSILKRWSVSRTAPHAEREGLATCLTALKFPLHESVFAFEETFGGLLVFESDPAFPLLQVGPFACLKDGHYTGHESDLVPVIFPSNDIVYSLDAEGRGYTRAGMVEGTSRFSARDGAQLLSQAILWRMLETAVWNDFEGAEGAIRAADLGLALLSEASSDVERWWGDGERFVAEIRRGNGYQTPRTYVVG